MHAAKPLDDFDQIEQDLHRLFVAAVEALGRETRANPPFPRPVYLGKRLVTGQKRHRRPIDSSITQAKNMS